MTNTQQTAQNSARLVSKSEFIAFLQNDERLKLSDFAVDRISEVLSAMSENPKDLRLLSEVVADLSLMQKGRIYAPELFNLMQEAIMREVKAEVNQLRIKGFKGTRYEELELLKVHYFRARLKALRLDWIIDGLKRIEEKEKLARKKRQKQEQ